MYKVLFFKFFLFVLYMIGGLISKIKEPSSSENLSSEFSKEQLDNIHMAGNPSNIGVATKWVNPYVTRFKKPDSPFKPGQATTKKRTESRLKKRSYHHRQSIKRKLGRFNRSVKRKNLYFE